MFLWLVAMVHLKGILARCIGGEGEGGQGGKQIKLTVLTLPLKPHAFKIWIKKQPGLNYHSQSC